MAAKKPSKKPSAPAAKGKPAPVTKAAPGKPVAKAAPAKPAAKIAPGKVVPGKGLGSKVAPGKLPPPKVGVKKPAAKKVPERTIVPPESERKLLKSPLSRAEMNHYRELLLRKREELVGDLRSLHDGAFKGSDQGTSANHLADYGTDNYEQDFNLGIIENEEAVVGMIDQALHRIDSGEFGVCLDCHVPVPKARLEAIPWSRQCVQCKAKAERG